MDMLLAGDKKLRDYPDYQSILSKDWYPRGRTVSWRHREIAIGINAGVCNERETGMVQRFYTVQYFDSRVSKFGGKTDRSEAYLPVIPFVCLCAIPQGSFAPTTLL